MQRVRGLVMDGLPSLSKHAMQVRQDPSVSDQHQMLCEHMISLIHCKLVCGNTTSTIVIYVHTQYASYATSPVVIMSHQDVSKILEFLCHHRINVLIASSSRTGYRCTQGPNAGGKGIEAERWELAHRHSECLYGFAESRWQSGSIGLQCFDYC
jgi:hypothetical protein